jgi:hypothetical protein
MPIRRLLAVLATALIMTGPALAADWVVMRLRGDVQIMVETDWAPLKRGDTVANEQTIRTLANGHAELQRDHEVVTLGSNTQVRMLQDIENGYTTVQQDFGRVEIDAEARRVKHFEVQTPYLAAVVKGTHFVVTSDGGGASVAVDRGAVAVHSVATERSTTISAGQMATVKRKTDLEVSGLGPWPPIREPGVNRPRIVAALGSALETASSSNAGGGLEFDGVSAGSGPAPVPEAGPASNRSGSVKVTAAAATLFGGFAAASPSAKASSDPAQPVSLTVVFIGALLGAALGALALLVRRGI